MRGKEESPRHEPKHPGPVQRTETLIDLYCRHAQTSIPQELEAKPNCIQLDRRLIKCIQECQHKRQTVKRAGKEKGGMPGIETEVDTQPCAVP